LLPRTRCQILWLKSTKFDFGWGSAPDPAGGAYSAPPDPLAGFKGPTSKGREGREWKGWERKGREGKRREGKGMEGREGTGREWRPKVTPPVEISQIQLCLCNLFYNSWPLRWCVDRL